MPVAPTIDSAIIDKSEVCRYLGYDRGRRLTTSMSSLIDWQAEKAQELIEPAFSCVFKKVEHVEGPHVFIDGPMVFTSNAIAGLLSKCHEVAVFVATIGNALEERSSQLMKEGEMVRAMVLDAVGSTAVEQLTYRLQESIEKRVAGRGAEIGRRYSPGYCDWNINQQKLLFDTLGKDSAGVELTEDNLMTPQKSISGIIGIGHDLAQVVSFCHSCPKKDCVGRRI